MNWWDKSGGIMNNWDADYQHNHSSKERQLEQRFRATVRDRLIRRYRDIVCLCYRASLI